MCIAFIYITKDDEFDQHHCLILSNRDEFLNRKASDGNIFWESEGYPGLLAGKDFEGGGTWFGVRKFYDEKTKTHMFKMALITNFREIKDVDKNLKSRGLLTLDFLKLNLENQSTHAFLEKVKETHEIDYTGYNLIIGDSIHGFHYISNRRKEIVELKPGIIYGVSNATLDTPWPKIENGKAKFLEIIKDNMNNQNLNELELAEQLLSVMNEPAQLEPLPKIFDEEIEKALSGIFVKEFPIKGRNYGTRAQNVLLIRSDHTIRLIERSYLLEKEAWILKDREDKDFLINMNLHSSTS